ncbi:MAG: hypothetical protein EXS15_07420 [Phycisphaerales bacterium]|nr:hypothetical protein [Phycisphaerales bacterium]
MIMCARIVVGIAITLSVGSAPLPQSQQLSWASVIEEAPDERVIVNEEISRRIRATGLPWRVRDKVSDIEMLLVPAGSFLMGASAGESDIGAADQPAHEVTISHPFYVGFTEVTQEQWVRMMRVNPSHFQRGTFQAELSEKREAKIKAMMNDGFTRQEADAAAGVAQVESVDTSDWPVESISLDDLQKYLQKTGLRLPTEAEWEYSCRAGRHESRYGELDAVAWFGANSVERTHSVATKVANPFGLHDTLGNVWEWCSDWYSADYYASCKGTVTDPTGPATGESRVVRGGNWLSLPKTCSATYRIGGSVGRPAYGFRVVRSP